MVLGACQWQVLQGEEGQHIYEVGINDLHRLDVP
jgi:hypothetical protein